MGGASPSSQPPPVPLFALLLMGNSLESIRYVQDQNFLLIMTKQFGFHHQITQNDAKNTEIKRSTLEKSIHSSL